MSGKKIAGPVGYQLERQPFRCHLFLPGLLTISGIRSTSTETQKGLPSTFFVIPVKGDPGLDAKGRARAKRAASYDLADVARDWRNSILQSVKSLSTASMHGATTQRVVLNGSVFSK